MKIDNKDLSKNKIIIKEKTFNFADSKFTNGKIFWELKINEKTKLMLNRSTKLKMKLRDNNLKKSNELISKSNDFINLFCSLKRLRLINSFISDSIYLLISLII